jgi:hypothetical protein
MAVLIEAVSFIARRDRLDECWPRGSQGFIADSPNESVCADEYLVRIGFMGPATMRAFIGGCVVQGLKHFEADGYACDFVTVDQVVGLITPCNWLDVGYVDYKGHQIRAARWVGDESPYIIFPDEWSLEQHLHFGNTRYQPEDPPSHFEFIRDDDGLYLYRDTRTGQEVWTTERIERKSSDISEEGRWRTH